MGHFDTVFFCVHEMLKKSHMTWFFRDVKGNQDDITSIVNIDILGQLNMIADVYA